MSEAQADWLETSVTAESFSMLQFVRTVRGEGSIKIPPPQPVRSVFTPPNLMGYAQLFSHVITPSISVATIH